MTTRTVEREEGKSITVTAIHSGVSPAINLEFRSAGSYDSQFILTFKEASELQGALRDILVGLCFKKGPAGE
jgi:hypothetical protein